MQIRKVVGRTAPPAFVKRVSTSPLQIQIDHNESNVGHGVYPKEYLLQGIYDSYDPNKGPSSKDL